VRPVRRGRRAPCPGREPKSVKILTALSLALLFALPAAADCLNPSPAEIPQCRGTVMLTTPSQTGAGVAIGYADDGVYVLTARHVVEKNESIEVTFYDKKDVSFPAQLWKYKDDVDLAVIKVISTKVARYPRDLPRFSVREDVMPDENVFIIGYRDRLPWQRDPERVSRPSDDGGDQKKFLFKSENLKLGHSGGPVFDAAGSLLGIAYNQHTPNDAGVLKISHFWDLLHLWGVASHLTKGAMPPVNTGPPPPAPRANSPTIAVELMRIIVHANGGGAPAGWSYQVFLGEEENISEGVSLFNEAIPTPPAGTSPPYALNLRGKKKEVPLSREDKLLLRVVATGPDAGHSQAQAPLDFSNEHNIAVGLTAAPRARAGEPAKAVFTFQFALRKVKVRHLVRKTPLVKAMEMGREDLKALMARGEKLKEEKNLSTLREDFNEWRTMCDLVFEGLDSDVRNAGWMPMMRDRKGRAAGFKAVFAEELDMPAGGAGRLRRDKLLARVRAGVKYLDRAIWRLRGDSPSEPSPRPVKTDAPQTPTAPADGPEPRLRLSGVAPASRRPTL
jgi:Trypsin-like peptidase domain